MEKEKEQMSYKMLLMLDYGYTVNDLLNTLEERTDLISMGVSFNTIFKMKWLRLKAEDERNGI
jgi:hypothetical protein